jgi:hypothetical protein
MFLNESEDLRGILLPVPRPVSNAIQDACDLVLHDHIVAYRCRIRLFAARRPAAYPRFPAERS